MSSTNNNNNSTSTTTTTNNTVITPSAPADQSKIDAQVRQISKAALELSTAAENIISWSSARVEHNIQAVYKDQYQVVEDVAAKLAAQRAKEVAKNGQQMLNDVDELKKTVTAMRSVLQDAKKVNRQLDGLEGLLDVMEQQQQQNNNNNGYNATRH